jgi:isoquinoline 1-oxidoreductase
VKLVWTREEEFTWAYFRPAGVIDVRSAVDTGGRLTAWEFHNYNSGTSAINTNYDVANRKIEFHPVDAPLRSGSYRGLAGTANHFARECHMDEMAALAGIEPLEFRLRNLKDERLRAVLQAAADKFGWGKSKGSFGIAGGFEKGSYVATCAEVKIEPGKPTRVVRVVQAYECGAVVNPDQLRNQNEGAVIMGLGGALFETIHFDNGKIVNPHFARYRVPRFRDVPKIEIVLVDRKDLPSAGAGETPIMTLAPAISNAIFAAKGERLRSLPLYPTPPPTSSQTGAAV